MNNKKPIETMLKCYHEKNYARLHMPGNKGQGMLPMSFDITELEGTDNLLHPIGAIKEANEKLAESYKMDYASMSTCGSTACVLAMLLCVDGKLLIGRDAHKSAITGILLGGIEADFVQDVSTTGYLQAIKATDAAYLYLTYPDYTGKCVNIEAICTAAHQKNIRVLVDSAHGAHFAYSSRLPAVPHMADAFCVSAHKTLPVCQTQSAILLGSKTLSKQLHKNLFLVHSTSPSYAMMQSIEAADAYMRENGETIDRWIDLCESIRNSSDWEFSGDDPTRFAISRPGYTGQEIYRHFQKHGIMGEMATDEVAVFLTGPVDLPAIKAFQEVPLLDKRNLQTRPVPLVTGEKVLQIREVRGKPTQVLPLDAAIGRISAVSLGSYPPGVACLLPGERLTSEVVTYLQSLMQQGKEIFGMSEEGIEVIR